MFHFVFDVVSFVGGGALGAGGWAGLKKVLEADAKSGLAALEADITKADASLGAKFSALLAKL